MDELIKLLETYGAGAVIILYILFIGATFGSIETVKKIKGYLDSYHNKKNAAEDKDKDVNERLDKLEKNQEKDQKHFEEITTSIEDLKKLIEQVQINQNRSNIATCRSTMLRVAEELINKGWMSQAEYDTLSDLSDVFIMSGGAKYKPPIINRALLLPVLTEEEIEKKRYNAMREQNTNNNDDGSRE